MGIKHPKLTACVMAQADKQGGLLRILDILVRTNGVINRDREACPAMFRPGQEDQRIQEDADRTMGGSRPSKPAVSSVTTCT